LKVKVEVGLKF